MGGTADGYGNNDTMTKGARCLWLGRELMWRAEREDWKYGPLRQGTLIPAIGTGKTRMWGTVGGSGAEGVRQGA